MDIEDRISALLDDPAFQLVDGRLGKFNIFEAVGGIRAELRHSNFLGFVLSPSRPHGLGTAVLLRFLRLALAQMVPELRPIRALELVLGDLDAAVVHREKDNIDLLIVIEELKLVCLVENKIDASAGEGQLARYRQLIASQFGGWRQIFVFLTPDGTEPDDEGYVALSYFQLAAALEAIGDEERLAIEVSTILTHYIDMLRRHIVPDEELQALARKLYDRHKEAFDFIFQARPQPANLLDHVRTLVEAAESISPDRNTPALVRFVPRAWASAKLLNVCPVTEWTKTGRNLLFEVKAWDTNRVAIFLIVGPASPDVRAKIYQGASTRPDLFRGLVRPMGGKWATIYIRDLLTAAASKSMERDEMAAAIRAGWEAFVADDLPLLVPAVLEIAEKSEA